ncbi:MAG: ion transporter [Bacteroidota bacterium]
MRDQNEIRLAPWREKIYTVIFGTDTKAGKLFDIILLIIIFASVIGVMLETVDSVTAVIGRELYILEWGFTIFFTLEYILRLISARKPLRYAFSFYGIIDFIAIIPTYLATFLTGGHYLLVVRALRLMRIFRIFKAAKFLKESTLIVNALKNSREKIAVFLVFVLLLVTLVGSIMYFVEGGSNPEFSSIPESIYWAIVTLTTVGYGDIHPISPLGQFLAAILMIMGYGVIAVPTGIVSAELVRSDKPPSQEITCRACGKSGHMDRAKYCDNCGTPLFDHISSQETL